MRMSSRSRFNPASIKPGAAAIALPPGPPARYTTGSGAGVGDTGGAMATARRMLRPLARLRFSGTTK
jgi:hypothetical protein